MQPFPKDQRELMGLAARHWRVFLAVLLAEAAGAAVSWAAVQPYGVWFFDLWIGAAAAAFPGVLLGTTWHAADAARRERTHVPLLLFLGALALALPVLGWLGIDEEAVRTFPF